jgi:hypothetical protein
MRPNTVYYEITVSPSLIWGRDFHAMSTILDSIWGHIHASLSAQILPNASYEDASVFFIQMQAYWFVNLKLVYEGMFCYNNMSTILTSE